MKGTQKTCIVFATLPEGLTLFQGSSRVAQRVTNLTSIHEDAGLISDLAQWLRIWHCHELWCRSKMRLGSGVAVALV